MNNEIFFDKSFASHEKAKCWSSENKLTAIEVCKSSNKKFIFECDTCKHKFSSTLNNVSNGTWCPFCANRSLCNDDNCKLCYEKSFASHEKAKCWSSRNELAPRKVFKSSGKKITFNCDKCNHEFSSDLSSISNGQWCPFCGNKSLCNTDNCVLCYKKSFASHEKANCWSHKNKLIARRVFKSSHKIFVFDCNKCNHEFSSRLNDISNGSWCPFCGNKSLCNTDNCVLCYEKSFASHEKAKCWSSKNKLTPREVFKSSHKKFKFDCDKCSHEFSSRLTDISNGQWCPFCGNKSLCNTNNCALCYEKSFASHEKANCWSSENELMPREVFKSSGKKITFNCDKCNHEFSSVLNNISQGHWCPFCVNKTEKIIYDYLKTIYKNLIKQQFKVNWCKNKRNLPYDFCIKANKIIIELDGPQHFKQVSNWSSPEEQFENDKFKEKCANENGYSVIRILQEDVLNDKYDWKTELMNNIEKIKTEKVITATRCNASVIQNIYMCKNREYDIYKNTCTLFFCRKKRIIRNCNQAHHPFLPQLRDLQT